MQDAIDDESTLDKSEDDQECMNIFFIIPGEVQVDNKFSWVRAKSRWPKFKTDYRINKEYCGSTEGGFGGNGGGTFREKYPYSLSICTKSTNDVVTLGCLHDNGLRLDNKNCMEAKFKSDDIPDPSKIYIIRNKKYVCEKIEMEVKDDAIEPVYTGYFYMLS